MKEDKVTTMIRFALKSRKIVIGADQLLQNDRAHCKIVLADRSLAQNTRKKIERFCEERRIALIETDLAAASEGAIAGCKVLGLTDPHMAGAVCEAIKENNNYSIILGGSNLG